MDQQAQSARSSLIVCLGHAQAAVGGETSANISHQFRSRYLTDILQLQGILLRRKILEHWNLASVCLEKASWMPNILRRGRNSDSNLKEASTVQIWTDDLNESRVTPKAGSIAQRPRRASSVPSTRRLVLYMPDAIYVFQLSRDFHISEKQHSNEELPFVDLVLDR